MSGRHSRNKKSQASPIHRGLTGARELIGTAYLADPELRRGYDRDIAPRTVAALTRVLGEVFARDAAQGVTDRLRAVDLGAGTGAVGVALRAHFGERVEVVAVDRYAGGAGVHALDVTLSIDLKALGGGFDLVIAAHLLNELFVAAPQGPSDGARIEKLAAVVRQWADRLLAPAGTMILIEPALRETSRALLQVRDRLLAVGLHIVAPCFCQTSCPALVRERDWCHDAAISVEGRRIDFSYLVVRRQGLGERASMDRVRIVSDPLPEKGKLRLFACGAGGREAVVRLNRHATRANADLDRLVRGDVARLAFETPADPHPGETRIAPDTRVERVDPRAPRAQPEKARPLAGEPRALPGT